VPVKKQTVSLVFNSQGGEGIRMSIQDLDVTTDLRKPNNKVIVNYLGGWKGQKRGSFSYPPDINGTFYSSQERRHLILKGLPGTILRVSIEFLNTDETDDFLEVYKFVKRQKKFVILRRYNAIQSI